MRAVAVPRLFASHLWRQNAYILSVPTCFAKLILGRAGSVTFLAAFRPIPSNLSCRKSKA